MPPAPSCTVRHLNTATSNTGTKLKILTTEYFKINFRHGYSELPVGGRDGETFPVDYAKGSTDLKPTSVLLVSETTRD